MQITVVAATVSGRSWYRVIRHRGETCRYFPDWADRPLGAGSYQEADRNSYDAGGYAEEFGYRMRRPSRAAPALMEDPEAFDCGRVYVEGLHPGYPERPRPCDRVADAGEPLRVHQQRTEQSPRQPRRAIRMIRVGDARRDHDVRKLLASLMSKWHELRIRHRQFGAFF